MAFPPLFVHRSPTPEDPSSHFHFDLSLNFGWYSAASDKRRFINPAGLFFGSFSERKAVWAALPLLMGYKRVGEQFNFGQFPLVWAWGNRHVRNLFAVPLFFRQKTPRSQLNVAAGIFWYGDRDLHDKDPSNDLKYFIGFPLYLHLGRGLKTFDVSPLYIAGGDAATGLKHRTLFPFFHWQSREHGNRTELWTPVWIQRRDRARDHRSWALPPLLSFGHSTPKRGVASFTPLVWSINQPLIERRSFFAGPYGHVVDPQQRAHWLLPLYGRFEDRVHNTRRTIFAPFFHSYRTPDRHRIDTLLFSYRKGFAGAREGDRRFGLHPLGTYFAREHDHQHQVVLGGLFWRKRQLLDAKASDPWRTSWGVGPLIYGSRGPDTGAFGIPPLLVFSKRKGDEHRRMLTPLVWNRRIKGGAAQPGGSDTWVVGPVYGQRRHDGWKAGVAPLWLGARTEERSYTVLPALLSGFFRDHKANEFRAVTPLFTLSKSPETRTLGVLGLVWDSERERSQRNQGEAGPGPGYARDSAFVPLYYRRQRGSDVLSVTPLGAVRRRGERKDMVLGPLAITRGPNISGNALFPLWYWQSKSDDSGRKRRNLVVPPLFLVHHRSPERELDVVTPLVWRRESFGPGAHKGLGIVPFYFRRREPAGVDLDLAPGFMWARNPTRRTHFLLAGPFFHRLTRKSLHTGVFPISWWMDSEDKRRLIALPLIVHTEDKKAGTHTTIAVPFWVDRGRRSGRRTWMAFPFVLGNERKTKFLRLSFVPPGFIDTFSLRRNSRFTAVLPFFFRHQKCGFQEGDADDCRYTIAGNFPLFMYGKGEGRRSHSALGLYYYDRDHDSRRLLTWLFGYRYVPNKRSAFYVGPFYRSVTQTHKATGFAPLFFHRKHRKEDRSTTMVLPPLFIGQRRMDKQWFQAALAVWQFRSLHRVSTVVLPPVFGHIHSYKERKVTWLAPLFLRDQNIGENKSWGSVFPLLALGHRDGDKRTFVQFPLVWHFAREDRKTTIGAALWYDITRGDTRTMLVPGVFAHRRSPTRRGAVLGPGLAWWWKEKADAKGEDSQAVGEEAWGRHWRALLGAFGGGRESNGRRYTHFFGARIYSKRSIKRSATQSQKQGNSGASKKRSSESSSKKTAARKLKRSRRQRAARRR